MSLDSQDLPSDDLKRVLAALRKHLLLFLFVFALPLLAAAAWIYRAVPQYTATATVMLDPRKQFVLDAPEVLPDVAPDPEVVDTQITLIESRAVLGRAVDRIGDAAVPASVAAAGRNRRIELLAEGFSVERAGLSSALHFNFTDENAQYAARVANVLAETYIEYQTELKQKATRDANQWLRARVAEVQKEVQAADAAVSAYRAKSGLLVAKGATSTETQLATVDAGLNDANQKLSDATARLAAAEGALKDQGNANAARVVSTPAMLQLRSQYASLLSQRAQLSTTFGAFHPQMQEIRRQIDSVQEQINAEATRAVEELRREVTLAQSKVNGLLAVRSQSRSQLAQDNAADVALTELKARADSLRQTYDGLLTRLQQTSAQESLAQVNATIISEALVPRKPSSPRVPLIAGVAAAAGLALGAFAVLLARLLDNTVTRPADLERLTRLPLLAMVPQLRRSDLRLPGRRRISVVELVPAKPLSLFAECFRALRVAVFDSFGRNNSLVIQFTSGTFAEGKTVCSIAFAQAAAADGKRVLLIDADVRRRSLTNYLNISAKAGLMELLAGTAELRDVIVPAGAGKMPHVLPLSTSEIAPQDSFASPRFVALLEQLRKGFDIVVLDSAPVLALAESLALASRVDAVVVAVRWGKTPVSIVMKALDEIHRVGGKVAGTLLTRVDVKKVTDQAYGSRHYSALQTYYQQ